MPEITFQEAKEFLDNITSEDKVAIIHHDDGDGFCSGILYRDWCKSKRAKTEHFTYKIRKSSLKDFPLEKFNKLIVCDLASDFMSEELEPIKDKQILYTDHHPRDTPLPKEIPELITTDQGYIPSSRTAGELTNMKPWLALTGTITDAGDLYQENQNFIEQNLKKINMTLDEFKQNVTSVITNFIIYFDENLDKAFEILGEINSIEEIEKLKQYSDPVEEEVQKFVNEYESKKEKLGDINYYYFAPHFSVKIPVAGIISQRNDDAYIFASPKNNGTNISFSARNTSQKMDMASLLKAGVKDLETGSAGGHKAAAAGMILAKDIDKFKENIRKFIAQ